MENKIKIERKGEKIINFLKKYGYFIVAGLVVVAITLTVILTTIGRKIPIDEKPIDEIPINTGAIKFELPLLDCSIATDYSVDKLIYNKTLGWFETHSAVDLVSASSTDVLAACAGTVVEIYTNGLEGTVIKIQHEESFTTLYGSLNEAVDVKIGDKVTAGQKIGTISASGTNEVLTGAHLHFQLLKDNIDVNPNDYINLQSK